MTKIRRRSILLTVGAALAILLFACQVSTSPGSPHITISPSSGGPNTQVFVSGAGFPPQTVLSVRIGPPDVGATPQSYGDTVADAEGQFRLAFVMPGRWPAGTPIIETDLVIVVINEDGSVKATAPFTYRPSAEAQPDLTLNPDSGVPGQQIDVVGQDFPPEAQIGLRLSDPETGTDDLDLAEVTPDDVGAFQVTVTVPIEWPSSGETIVEPELIVEAVDSAVGQTLATAPFVNAADTVDTVDVFAAIRTQAASQLGLAIDAVQVKDLQPTEWSDGCLGVPNEAEICAQVTTPGYGALLEAGGLQYEVRASSDGALVRLIPGAASSARQVVAQQLHANLGQVRIVSFERVEWPDACLGVAQTDEICAQVVTPGYRVVLEADGQRYMVHADESGGALRLADAPQPTIPDVAVVWTSDGDGTCQKAMLGAESVAFGSCDGVLMNGHYAVPERAEAFTTFVEAFAPFEVDTPAGHVVFTGFGATVATPAEQRMIAEWARLAALEAAGGRDGASYGLALAWHREGGSAGFCDDLAVYATGDVFASSCQGEQPQNVGRARLTAVQLTQLYGWLEALRNFELEHRDTSVPDAPIVRVVFSGVGVADATDADAHAIQDFAARLFAEFVP